MEDSARHSLPARRWELEHRLYTVWHLCPERYSKLVRYHYSAPWPFPLSHSGPTHRLYPVRYPFPERYRKHARCLASAPYPYLCPMRYPHMVRYPKLERYQYPARHL